MWWLGENTAGPSLFVTKSVGIYGYIYGCCVRKVALMDVRYVVLVSIFVGYMAGLVVGLLNSRAKKWLKCSNQFVGCAHTGKNCKVYGGGRCEWLDE